MSRLVIRQIMSSPVATMHRQTPLREASRLLLAGHVSGMPVVDDDGRTVGVISKTDILDRVHNDEAAHGLEKLFYRSAFGAKEPLAAGFHVDAELDGVAEDAMTPLVLELDADTPVTTAARLMVYEGVHRVLVREHGKTVGIVSTMDIVRAVARGELLAPETTTP